MKRDKVEKFIGEHVKLITIDAKSLADAEERAGKFLIAEAVLATALRDLEVALSKAKSIQEMCYAEALEGLTGTVVEKTAQVKIAPKYMKAREASDELDANKNWLRTYLKIFENAHILFRGLIKHG